MKDLKKQTRILSSNTSICRRRLDVCQGAKYHPGCSENAQIDADWNTCFENVRQQEGQHCGCVSAWRILGSTCSFRSSPSHISYQLFIPFLIHICFLCRSCLLLLYLLLPSPLFLPFFLSRSLTQLVYCSRKVCAIPDLYSPALLLSLRKTGRHSAYYFLNVRRGRAGQQLIFFLSCCAKSLHPSLRNIHDWRPCSALPYNVSLVKTLNAVIWGSRSDFLLAPLH